MSEHAERYRRVAAGFSARVDGIADDQWAAPTPCPRWTVRHVVGHVVSVHRAILAGLDVAPPPPPADDPDLAVAWNRATGDIVTALADPARASAPVSGRFAPMPFEQLVGMLGCFDTLVHTWDLARATGLDEHLDAELVHGLLEGMEPLDDLLRSSGQYGPRVAVPDDADEQTRLIAFTGRRP
jgi:uncharacterized protein (TIGR03086 family)